MVGLRIAATFGTHWISLTQVISGFFLDPEDDTMSPAKATRCKNWCRHRRSQKIMHLKGLGSYWKCIKNPGNCLLTRCQFEDFLERAARFPSGRSSAFISRACPLGKPPMPGRMAHLSGHRRLYGPCQCHRSKAADWWSVERLTDAKVIEETLCLPFWGFNFLGNMWVLPMRFCRWLSPFSPPNSYIIFIFPRSSTTKWWFLDSNTCKPQVSSQTLSFKSFRQVFLLVGKPLVAPPTPLAGSWKSKSLPGGCHDGNSQGTRRKIQAEAHWWLSKIFPERNADVCSEGGLGSGSIQWR